MTTKKPGVKAKEISRQLQATGKPFLMLIEDGEGGFYFDWKLSNMGSAFVFAGFAIKIFLNSAAENGNLNRAKCDLKKIIDATTNAGLNDLKKAFGVI